MQPGRCCCGFARAWMSGVLHCPSSMSRGRDYDGDACRKAAVEDGIAVSPWRRGLSLSLPTLPARSEEDAERELRALRRRAERLVDVLLELVRSDPPPTMPDTDEAALVAFASSIEERIAVQAVRHGHRYARRAAGTPWSCGACARPIDRAAERCSTAAGSR
jgi:hypothetical protein